ncbi:unnamed protein product [marine sediment metagenome]|uniref:Lipoprotein n=1 Tax=marine sediment metagenome TaxID=412755 RepID=X1AP95_9ZZZZ
MKNISDVKVGVLFCIVMLCTVIITGCALFQRSDPPIIPPTSEIQTIIKNISWIQGILIIGVVGSIFACFNGAAKIGIPLLISSLVGYGLTSAMLFYAKLIAIMSLIGGVTLCGYMIFLKHRALREIVRGVQSFRDGDRIHKFAIDPKLKFAQKSKSTRKIVKKIKEKVNGSS